MEDNLSGISSLVHQMSEAARDADWTKLDLQRMELDVLLRQLPSPATLTVGECHAVRTGLEAVQQTLLDTTQRAKAWNKDIATLLQAFGGNTPAV